MSARRRKGGGAGSAVLIVLVLIVVALAVRLADVRERDAEACRAEGGTYEITRTGPVCLAPGAVIP